MSQADGGGGASMRLFKYGKLSAWDIAYAGAMAVACVITYWIMLEVHDRFGLGASSRVVGSLWAIVATIYVFRDTRANSLSASIGRIIATVVSFALCFAYLLLFPFTAIGLVAVMAGGTLVMMALGRREEISLTAVTTAVVMLVAAIEAQNAWQQPLLRLMDTFIGIAVGVACKWIASFVFFKLIGEEVR
jgi:uncharacterized membrane protein YccC